MSNPTRLKLNETQFYLSKLKDNYSNELERRFYLSAFLSAARSVIDFMKAQYSPINGFKEWYDEKLGEWKNDNELVALIKIRNINIHEDQPKTETEATTRMAHTLHLTKEVLEVPMSEPIHINASGVAENPKIEWWRFTEPEDYDILHFSESILNKLNGIICECERKFAK